MISPRLRVAGLAAAAILAVACGGSTATPTPTAAPPTPVATPALTPAPTPTPTPSPEPTHFRAASIASDQLVAPGSLTVCSDLTSLPQAFTDENGAPTGSDIEIADEIALRLGLKLAVLSTPSAKLNATLAAHSCDVIVSGQAITAAQLNAAHMIPYFHAGQSLLVAKGNPKNIKTTLDLCNKSAGAFRGSPEMNHLAGNGSYNPALGLSSNCQAAHLQTIKILEYRTGGDAVAGLTSGKIAAFLVRSPLAGYYVLQQPSAVEVVPGILLDDVKEGIAVSKARPDVEIGVKLALKTMLRDGTYIQILMKYGDESGTIV